MCIRRGIDLEAKKIQLETRNESPVTVTIHSSYIPHEGHIVAFATAKRPRSVFRRALPGANDEACSKHHQSRAVRFRR